MQQPRTTGSAGLVLGKYITTHAQHTSGGPVLRRWLAIRTTATVPAASIAATVGSATIPASAAIPTAAAGRPIRSSITLHYQCAEPCGGATDNLLFCSRQHELTQVCHLLGAARHKSNQLGAYLRRRLAVGSTCRARSAISGWRSTVGAVGSVAVAIHCTAIWWPIGASCLWAQLKTSHCTRCR